MSDVLINPARVRRVKPLLSLIHIWLNHHAEHDAGDDQHNTAAQTGGDLRIRDKVHTVTGLSLIHI